MQKNNKVKFGVILGSGLDTAALYFNSLKLVSEELHGIHSKRIYLLDAPKASVVLYCGRKHFYEGYTRDEINSNIQDAASRGVKYMLITNAAGGINVNYEKSDLMMIHSHINLNSKLRNEMIGFPYDEGLNERFKKICSNLKIKFYSGVYACLPGPAYETNSEISFLKKTGADAVGMSTVPEVMQAKILGIKVLGVSVITNLLRENHHIKTTHKSVLETSKKASEKLFFVVKRLANELK
jgi:purine-nucleoside phosphorylase